MTEFLSKAFETPELASTNVLSLLTLWLAVITAAEGHLWVRTHRAAKRLTVVILTVVTRRGVTKERVEVVEVPKEYTAGAKRLHRNASIHRY